jgi:uncharacterized protein with HEPN domain
VQIISEAARALPPDFLAKYSAAPWSAIIGIGNILRHEYQRLDDKQLPEIRRSTCRNCSRSSRKC